MKYPCLVPKRLCKTPVHVHLESEGLSNLGEPLHVYDADLLCNFQDKAKTILTAEKKLVQITGTALVSRRHCAGYAILKWWRADGIWRGASD